jgi:hypothetical protein
MVIPSIDERDAHRCFGERLRRGKPGEASADNDDMFADAVRDCSNRNGVILDPFGGAGTTLGHANATTTARYAHLDADPLRRASERIGSTIAAAMGDGTVPGSAKIIRVRE